MKVLIFIGGGMSFSTYEDYISWLGSEYILWSNVPYDPESKKKWKYTLAKKWIESGGVVYIPDMPCDLDAKYCEWKIVFEGVLSRLCDNDEVTYIGHSLGGNFLLKYFSEASGSNFSSLFLSTASYVHLVASCVSEGDFTAPESYGALKKLGDRVHIWHAEDDMIVPFSTASFLSENLPEAVQHFFPHEKGYGHFSPLESFPELENILLKK